MNVAAMQAVLLHSRSANAARMVLLVLASHSNERGHVGALPITELCREANASERTVKYAIRELRDELKELKADRDREGRGSTFEFDISPLLEKVQNLHASDKHADVAPIEEKGAEAAPIPPDKGANNVEIDADIAPLSDSKGANFTGTPVAPLEAETTSKNKPLANARSARAKAKPESVELPDWLPREVWGEWEQYNRERRTPLPATTVKVQLRQLAEFRARGMPPEKVIAQSIARNWKGLFEVREQNGHAQPSAHRNGDRPRKPGLAERAREAAEYFRPRGKAGGAG